MLGCLQIEIFTSRGSGVHSMEVFETKAQGAQKVTQYPRPSPRLQKQKALTEILPVALSARLARSARDAAVMSSPLC